MTNPQLELWHYSVGGMQMGPTTFPILNEMVRHGDLPRECMVWRAGMEQWVRLDQAPEFAQALAQAPAMAAPYPAYYTPQQPASGLSIASLVLGIIGLFTWWIPALGLAVAVSGLVMGAKGMNLPGRGMAIAGLVLSIISLLLAAIMSIAFLVALSEGRFR